MINTDAKINTLLIQSNLQQFTEGDPQFKTELVLSMIANLNELRQSIKEAIILNPDIYYKTVHKLATTLAVIDDEELSGALELLKEHFRNLTPVYNMYPVVQYLQRRSESIEEVLRNEIGSDL